MWLKNKGVSAQVRREAEDPIPRDFASFPRLSGHGARTPTEDRGLSGFSNQVPKTEPRPPLKRKSTELNEDMYDGFDRRNSLSGGPSAGDWRYTLAREQPVSLLGRESRGESLGPHMQDSVNSNLFGSAVTKAGLNGFRFNAQQASKLPSSPAFSAAPLSSKFLRQDPKDLLRSVAQSGRRPGPIIPPATQPHAYEPYNNNNSSFAFTGPGWQPASVSTKQPSGILKADGTFQSCFKGIDQKTPTREQQARKPERREVILNWINGAEDLKTKAEVHKAENARKLAANPLSIIQPPETYEDTPQSTFSSTPTFSLQQRLQEINSSNRSEHSLYNAIRSSDMIERAAANVDIARVPLAPLPSQSVVSPQKLEKRKQDLIEKLDSEQFHIDEQIGEAEEEQQEEEEVIQERWWNDEHMQMLTEMEQSELRRGWGITGDPKEVLVEGFGSDTVQRRSLQTLKDCQWLNDEVVNFSLKLIQKRNTAAVSAGHNQPRCFIANTFFYTQLSERFKGYRYANVQRYLKRCKVDLFQLDRFIVPVNPDENHWALILVNFKLKRLEYYDSLHGYFPEALENVANFVNDESIAKRQEPWEEVLQWPRRCIRRGIPTQGNGFDCGVFMISFADRLSAGLPVNITRRKIPLQRRKLAVSILASEINLVDSGETNGDDWYEASDSEPEDESDVDSDVMQMNGMNGEGSELGDAEYGQNGCNGLRDDYGD